MKITKNSSIERIHNSVLLAVTNTEYGDMLPIQCDLHLNLWKCNNAEYMLDLGLMLFDIDFFSEKDKQHNFDAIVIYLPYKCQPTDIQDLGKRLNDNSESVSTIFNEFYPQVSGPEMSSMKMYYRKADETEKKKDASKEIFSFYLYALGDNDIQILPTTGIPGTFIKLAVAMSNEMKQKKFNLYVRFRINITSADGIRFLKHDEHISNNVLQAAFSRMELYDCRFNDIRDTNDKVYQELTDCKRLNSSLLVMRKVHFFFMSDAKDHITNGNMERMDTRMLEIEKWNIYIGSISKHAYVAYHWKKTPKKEEDKTFASFEVFFRDTCDNRNILLILAYVLFAIALGTTGSLMSTIDLTQSINVSGIIANALIYAMFYFILWIEKKWNISK